MLILLFANMSCEMQFTHYHLIRCTYCQYDKFL